MRYVGWGTQMLVMIGLAVYAGIKLDERWHIAPLLTVVLPLVVLASSFYKLIKDTSKRKNDNGTK
ncbi:MAG: AtpZ/AtpI family protein [Niabella sp.]